MCHSIAVSRSLLFTPIQFPRCYYWTIDPDRQTEGGRGKRKGKGKKRRRRGGKGEGNVVDKDRVFCFDEDI